MVDREIPRFEAATVDARLTRQGLGTAFQSFAAELLAEEYPDLRVYPALGRDGGADLAAPDGNGRVIIECKHITNGTAPDAERAWKQVFAKLRENLADPNGPRQAQFRIWYADRRPISKYVFCTSAFAANEARTEELTRTIETDLAELAAQRAHLVHLADVRVEVIGWNSVVPRLLRHRRLAYRWFPSVRPNGLEPVWAALPPSAAPPVRPAWERRRFREFLDQDVLPYYSIREHQNCDRLPIGAPVHDEATLLTILEQSWPAIVITGPGGVGKSRLSLELGRLADRWGWLVVRAEGPLAPDAVEHLCRSHTSSEPVLLLLDYIEREDRFGEIIERLFARVDPEGGKLLIAAICRTSYYSMVRGTFPHTLVNLAAAGHEWLRRYHEATVVYILESGGLLPTEAALAACRGIPMLAVLLHYITSIDPDADLEALRGNRGFGDWIASRIRVSFPQEPGIGRELANYMALLDMPSPPPVPLRRPPYGALHDTLANDGWIEAAEYGGEANRWVAAHDVLADQILIGYCEDNAAVRAEFIDELFMLAEQADLVGSALRALERVAEDISLAARQAERLVGTAIRRAPDRWRALRGRLLRTPILTHGAAFRLVREHLWDAEAAADLTVQGALAWIARQVAANAEPSITADLRQDFERCVLECAEAADASNFAITAALRLDPLATRIAAFRWIERHPAEPQTHFLLREWLEHSPPLEPREVERNVVRWLDDYRRWSKATFVYRAWLDATKDGALVEVPIRDWLAHADNRLRPDAQFVYRAWLDATKDRALVEQPIRDWLAHEDNRLRPDAQFVYRAWLDATKDRALVEVPIRDWLAHADNRLRPDAQFVYRAWLDATKDRALVEESIRDWVGVEPNKHLEDIDFICRAWLESAGDFDLVRDALITWLHKHRESPEGVYVTKILSKQPTLPLEAIRDILAWCRTFAADDDAIWRLSSLKRHLLTEGLEVEVLETAEEVLEPILFEDREIDRSISLGISCLVYNVLHISRPKEELRQRGEAMFVRWLRYPAAYGNTPATPKAVQSARYVQTLADLVLNDQIDPCSERESVARFLVWVNGWEPDRKAQLHRLLTYLKHNCPCDGVWEIVECVGSPAVERLPMLDHTDIKDALEWLATTDPGHHRWSYVWEGWWGELPGDDRLVELGKWWLRSAPPGTTSWPYVWAPLFAYLSEDADPIEVALWWLEHRGPRKHGAWAYVWKLLWDHDRWRDRLEAIGLSWVDAHGLEENKYWWDIWMRLWLHGVHSDGLARLADARIIGAVDGAPVTPVWPSASNGYASTSSRNR